MVNRVKQTEVVTTSMQNFCQMEAGGIIIKFPWPQIDYARRLQLTKILHWSGDNLRLFDSISHFCVSLESWIFIYFPAHDLNFHER